MLYRNNQFLCGDYVRLSHEDGDKLESNSIHNQKELISDYHKNHPELIYVKTYVDDGYSGTNFDRPAFQRMMQDAQNGFINCIIVKDLSRLGRDYIEMGRYTERVFPLMGIRFIAINDHYDSAKDRESSSIIIPFKNLINDAYSRDVSIKIRSHLDVKRKNGKFIGSFAGYGYMKDPEDKNHLIEDEYASGIVRKIFEWKLDGMSSQRIAHHLDDMGVLPPKEYKLSCGLNYTGGFSPKQDSKWSVNAVNRILRNEMYTGTMVQGKHKKINYKLKKQVDIDKKDWIRVEDAHEAIISKDTFNQAQNMLKFNFQAAPGEETTPMFAGFLKCGACGGNMIRQTRSSGGKRYLYYSCGTYYTSRGKCTFHLVSEKSLIQTVTLAIQKQAALLTEAKKAMTAVTKKSEGDRNVKKIEDQISQLDAEVGRYRDLKNHLSDDLRDGIISLEEYKDLGSRFIRQMKKSQDTITQLKDKKKSLQEREDHAQPWIDKFCSYRNITQLNRKVLIETVDHITVYSKDNIEVHFLYEDEMNELLGQTEVCKDDAVEHKKDG